MHDGRPDAFLVADDPDLGRDTKRSRVIGRLVRARGCARVGTREREPVLVGRLEELQREDRCVEVALDIPQIVTGAFLEDASDLGIGRRRWLPEQLRQALCPIANRYAVDLEHISILHPARRGRRFDQHQIRQQFPVRDGVASSAGQDARSTPRLHVALFGHDTGKVVVERRHIGTRTTQYLAKRRLLRGRPDGPGPDADREDDEQRRGGASRC